MGEVLYGGPYAAEVDAIRDERVLAAKEDREPDFRKLFAGVPLSAGAVKVISDIENPIPPFDGNHVHNVEKPEEGYTFPADGGLNIVDKEAESL